MYKIIALIGEAGAGKDALMKSVLCELPGLHEIVSCTTRPMREGEKEGVNYFYMTPDKFAEKVLNGEMLEATQFNGWFYGTALQSLDESVLNIGVFNPAGIEALLESPLVDVTVYRICTSDKERLLRQLNREGNPDVNEIIRRFKADQEDFCDLDFLYTPVSNETLVEFDEAIATIVSQIQTSGN
jgi:guanylate kinase